MSTFKRMQKLAGIKEQDPDNEWDLGDLGPQWNYPNYISFTLLADDYDISIIPEYDEEEESEFQEWLEHNDLTLDDGLEAYIRDEWKIKVPFEFFVEEIQDYLDETDLEKLQEILKKGDIKQELPDFIESNWDLAPQLLGEGIVGEPGLVLWLLPYLVTHVQKSYIDGILLSPALAGEWLERDTTAPEYSIKNVSFDVE